MRKGLICRTIDRLEQDTALISFTNHAAFIAFEMFGNLIMVLMATLYILKRMT